MNSEGAYVKTLVQRPERLASFGAIRKNTE